MEARTSPACERSMSLTAHRGTVFVLGGLLLIAAPAWAAPEAAGWRDGADRPSRSERPLDESLRFDAIKRGTADPIGDTFGMSTPQIDATSLDVAVSGGELVISVTFAGTVTAPDSGGADAIDGFIDVDADQNGNTGDIPWTDFITGSDTTGMGNEFYVDLFSYSGDDGAADLVDDLSEEVAGRVAVDFTSHSMTIAVPLALVDGDGSVDVAAIVGTAAEATDVVPNSGSVSGPDPTAALIHGNRFRVTVDWRGFEDPGGAALVSELRTDDSALFYFIDPDNLELLVKVIDACSFNDHYWVFYAAATDVEFTVTVTDTRTGSQQQYSNPLGRLGGGINDTFAFATCP